MSLLTITLKDLRLVARDRAALLFMVLVPIVVVTIVAVTLGGGDAGRIRLPVVNDDQGPVAQALIEALAKHVEVIEVEREEAERMVGEENRAGAALLLPGGLSKRYLASRPSTLTLLTDPAKGVEVDVVKAFLLLADRETATLADPFFEELLGFEERNATGSRLAIPPYEQNVPGFSVMFVLMAVLFGVAFGIRDEQEWGALTRLRIAPIPRWAFLGGKLLARFVLGVLQMLVLFGFGHLVFDVSLGRSPLAFLAMTLAVVFAMTGFSLLVAAFARTREQIIPLGLTVIMLVCAIGGCWWPLFQMPSWLQEIAHLTLTAWAMDGLHDLILRERSLVEVAPILGILVAYGAACMAAGVRLHRFAG
jgi:ABC-2 type transport system permease protein